MSKSLTEVAQEACGVHEEFREKYLCSEGELEKKDYEDAADAKVKALAEQNGYSFEEVMLQVRTLIEEGAWRCGHCGKQECDCYSTKKTCACGAVLDRAAYRALSGREDVVANEYFPAYRNPALVTS